MKKLIVSIMLLCGIVRADYLGSWAEDATLTFCITTSQFSTGAGDDATGSPAYRVYENETGTPVDTGSMAKLDDAGTLGFYSEALTLTSAGSKYEEGKSYNIFITATVDGVAGTTHHSFQIGLDVGTVRGSVPLDVSNDTIPEPTASTVPPTTPTIEQFWSYMYNYLFFGERQITGTLEKVLRDDNAAAYERPLSTDGTTTTIGQVQDSN